MEDRVIWTIQNEEQKLKDWKKMNSVSDPWYNSTQSNICVMVVPEREERDNGAEKIIRGNKNKIFPNVLKNMNPHISKSQWLPSKIKKKKKKETHQVTL